MDGHQILFGCENAQLELCALSALGVALLV